MALPSDRGEPEFLDKTALYETLDPISHLDAGRPNDSFPNQTTLVVPIRFAQARRFVLVVVTSKVSKMDNLWLVFARCISWDKDAWRYPSKVWLAIRELKQIAASENASSEERAEANMLVRNLNAALKPPPVDWTKTL